MDTSEKVKEDAAEFGVHVKAGGWRLGLLVARNVEKGQGGPRTVSTGTVSKVTAREFAEASGTSPARVLRYLKAWESAAKDNIVPAADRLRPGHSMNLDAERLPDWSDYYAVAGLNGVSEERRKSYEAAADEAGTTAGNVARTANNPAAIRAAIKADPKVREAAMKALDDTYQTTPPMAGRPDTSKPLALIGEFRTLHRTIERLMNLIVDGKAVVSDAERGALLQEVAWLQNALGYIESGLNAGSLDKALAALMEEEV